jgi:hypothetical protein
VRRPVSQEVVDLALLMARGNPTWGYKRTLGALANLGHEISDSTGGTILRAHGIDPAPDRRRQTTWKSFLKAHWDVLAAIDFTTIEVWAKGRPNHLLPALRHGNRDPAGLLRGVRSEPRRPLDDADGMQPYGRHRRIPAP